MMDLISNINIIYIINITIQLGTYNDKQTKMGNQCSGSSCKRIIYECEVKIHNDVRDVPFELTSVQFSAMVIELLENVKFHSLTVYGVNSNGSDTTKEELLSKIDEINSASMSKYYDRLLAFISRSRKEKIFVIIDFDKSSFDYDSIIRPHKWITRLSNHIDACDRRIIFECSNKNI